MINSLVYTLYWSYVLDLLLIFCRFMGKFYCDAGTHCGKVAP